MLKIAKGADPTEKTFEPYGLFGVEGNGKLREGVVNGLIYLVGLIVVIMFILSFFGLR